MTLKWASTCTRRCCGVTLREGPVSARADPAASSARIVARAHRPELRGCLTTVRTLVAIVVQAFRHAGHADDVLALRQVDEAHSLRVASDDRDAFDGRAYDLATVGNEHDVVV